MKLAFSLILCILFSISTYAQLQQEIAGKVIDKESKAALSGAIIQLLNSPVSTISDSSGNFRITVPVGRVSIKVSYPGYEEAIVSALEVNAGKETFLNIELRESIATYRLEDVVVKGNSNKLLPLNSMAAVSARMVSPEDANRYAGGYGDPARMVSSFAGIATVGDQENDIVIRGNSPRGMQWKMDGIEIPSPNHFSRGQGATGGAFSIISSNILSNSDFYIGAFPAEYGNATSGIMDLNMRNGNDSHSYYSFLLGVVGVEMAAEGPLKKQGGSWLFNYRFANFQPLNKIGLLGLDENQKAPIFQDLAFKITLQTKKAGNVTVFGLGGMSTTGARGIQDSLQWQRNNDLKNDESYNEKMGVAGLQHSLNFSNKKTFLKSTLAFTYEYTRADFGTILTKKDNTKYPGFNIDGTYSRFNTEKDLYDYPSLKLSSILNHKVNAHHSIRTGIILSYLGFNVSEIKYNSQKSATQKKIVYDTLANSSGGSSMAESFLQWKYRVNDHFEVNTGFHVSFLTLNNNSAIEPRIGLKWQLSDRSSVSYGFGIHSRMEPISTYFTIIRQTANLTALANKNLDFTKSLHNIIGYDLTLSNNIHLKSEVYYQYQFNVPVKANSHSAESILNLQYGRPDTTYSNTGKGYNKGIELTIEKNYSNNYYFLITGSFFDSKYKAGDGKLYNTYFNGKYAINWLLGKDFNTGITKQNILGVNMKLLLRGGFRYTGMVLTSKGVVSTEPFSERSPDFFRSDIGLKYRVNHQKYSWIVSIDIQNITNRMNILYYKPFHIGNKISMNPEYGLGIIPVLNFKVQF